MLTVNTRNSQTPGFIDEATRTFLGNLTPYLINSGIAVLGGVVVVILGRESDGESYSSSKAVGILAAFALGGGLLGHGIVLMKKSMPNCFAYITACPSRVAALFSSARDHSRDRA